jgi:hypothetical protein
MYSPPPDLPEAAAVRHAAARLRPRSVGGPPDARPALDDDRAAPELREAVCAYVRALRDRGALAEHALVAVRTLVQEGLGAPAHDSRRMPHESDALVARAVSWCVEEYYRRE